MNIITKNINLNVSQPNNFQLITAMQNDNETVKIVATLYNGNALYTIGSDVDLIRVVGKCANDALVDKKITEYTEHSVTFTLSNNMLASDGDMNLTIILANTTTGQELSVYPFCVKVQNSPMGNFSQTEMTTITDYILEAKKYSDNATNKASSASTSEKNAKASAISAQKSAQTATTQATNASNSATSASKSAQDASNYADNANTSASASSVSATNAKTSETASKNSETNAKKSEVNSKTSETNSKISETNSALSESNALKSENDANTSALNSATSETNAKKSETNALSYMNTAKTYRDESLSYKNSAATSATTATNKANESSDSASYALGSYTSAKEAEENAESFSSEANESATTATSQANLAKTYAEQAKQAADGIVGGLKPLGTIIFSALPTTGMSSGNMYNISNNFVSDNRFKDGGNISYSAGTNVYFTTDGYWDCLSGDMSGYMQVSDYNNVENKSSSTIRSELTKTNVTDALGYTPPTTNTTYGTATTTANGLMSSDDKTKLNGIATGANNYTLPTASSTLGGVKTTSTVTSNADHVACPIIGGVPYYKDTNTWRGVQDNLTSTATDQSLSANQGKILKGEVDEINSNIATNLLKPTLATTTRKEVTLTNNGDGTYTLNGTATGLTYFQFYPKFSVDTGIYTLSGHSSIEKDVYLRCDEKTKAYKGSFELLSSDRYYLKIRVNSGQVYDNVVVKPMLEVGTVAHDFVPYTGDSGRLNEDVASKMPKSAMSNSKVITTKGESVADAYELNKANSDSYAKAVQDQFDAVNDSLPQKLEWNTLNNCESSVFGAIVTSTAQTYSLHGGRKFSEYAIYTFNLILDDNFIAASVTLTANVWRTIKAATLFYIASNGDRFGCDVVYVSDTSYKQTSNALGSGRLRVQITANTLVTNNGTIIG